MLRILSLYMLPVLITLQPGCSSPGSDGEPNGGCAGSATELEGSWKYCDTISGNYTGYTFKNSCMTLTLREYANVDCSGAILSSDSTTYEFSLGNYLLTDGGQLAREIDVGTGSGAQYDIYMLDIDTLYRGLITPTKDMSSASARPTALNFDYPYSSTP